MANTLSSVKPCANSSVCLRAVTAENLFSVAFRIGLNFSGSSSNVRCGFCVVVVLFFFLLYGFSGLLRWEKENQRLLMVCFVFSDVNVFLLVPKIKCAKLYF